MRYKVEYDRNACIGAAACAAVDPVHFVMSEEDMKADLAASEKTTPVREERGMFVFETDDIEDLKAAAESCPVNVIMITDLETGERIV